MEAGGDEHAVRDRDPRAAQEHGLQLPDHRAQLGGLQRAVHHRGDLLHRQGRRAKVQGTARETVHTGEVTVYCNLGLPWLKLLAS